MAKMIKLVGTDKIKGAIDISSVTAFKYQPCSGQEFLLSEQEYEHPQIQFALKAGFFKKAPEKQTDEKIKKALKKVVSEEETVPVVSNPNKQKMHKTESTIKSVDSAYSPAELPAAEQGDINFVDQEEERKRAEEFAKRKAKVTKLQSLKSEDGTVETTPVVVKRSTTRKAPVRKAPVRKSAESKIFKPDGDVTE